MTDTLHSVARRMAAAGRLPGITFSTYWNSLMCGDNEASDAYLAWSAIQHAIDNGWRVINGDGGRTKIATQFGDEQDGFSSPIADADGTTALSVLLAVEKACDAAEGASDERQ